MFQVPSVLLVPAMIDNRARQRQEKEQRQKKKGEGFEAIFQETCEDVQLQGETSYRASGYTKDAKSFSYTVRKREYV